jgi:GTP-binding protein
MTLAAQFVASALALGDCPQWERIEVAIAGRSNVGKSSLINAVTGVKGLARTSKTPGRTRALNFFSIGDGLAIVDLPGFGYAKMSHTEAARTGAMLSEYLERRRNLAAILILIDVRRGPQRDELSLAEASRRRGLDVIVVATKSDKLSRSERARAAKTFTAISRDPIWCSATDGEGLETLRRKLLRFAGAGARPTPSRQAR